MFDLSTSPCFNAFNNVLAVLISGVFWCLLAQTGSVNAQQIAAKPADTSSPRATLKSFIESCNDFYRRVNADRYFDRTTNEHVPQAMRILDCLDTSQLPKFELIESAGEAATMIKEVLDRVDLPAFDEVPGAEEIEEEPISRWKIPGTRFSIVHITEGPRRGEYLFSAETIENAIDNYNSQKSLPYRTQGPETSPGFYDWYSSAPGHPTVAKIVDTLPAWARTNFKGTAWWKWIGLSISVLLALLLMAICYWFQVRIARKNRDLSITKYVTSILFAILAMLVPLLFLQIVYDYLTIRGSVLSVTGFAAYVVALLSSMVVIMGLSNRIAALLISYPKINPQGLDAQFIKIVTKLISIAVNIIIFLEGGRFLGIPLTTLLASAGVGGLAIALAVQDSLKNLFGTIMLLSDKPFRVGERIKFSNYDGFVEDIGLRSTKIRLLNGNQAAIPNEVLARTDIENVGRRERIRQDSYYPLPNDLPVSQIQQAVAIIKKCLDGHEGQDEEFPPQVHLNRLKGNAVEILVTFWFHPPEHKKFLEFNEKVHLEILDQLQAAGIKLAKQPFISQSTSGPGNN